LSLDALRHSVRSKPSREYHGVMSSFIRKAGELIRSPRLPWVVSSTCQRLENRFHYALNGFGLGRVGRRGRFSHDRPYVVIKSGFHKTSGSCTGAQYAIAGIANALSRCFNVEFATFPESLYNRLLSPAVRLTQTPRLDAECYICDAECDHSFLAEVTRRKRPLIVTCHSFLERGHGLSPSYLRQSIAYASHVHFVSAAQRDSFDLEMEECTVIPNFNSPITKLGRTWNVGAVGNFNSSEKNADATVRIGLQSSAVEIHLWYCDADYWASDRVRIHPFERNKRKVFESFDVMVYMTKTETFGLVVAEALSAGIPCVLAPIPAFEEWFSSCPGVEIVDPSDSASAAAAVDRFLRDRELLSVSIKDYWFRNFSENAVGATWIRLVSSAIEERLPARGSTTG